VETTRITVDHEIIRRWVEKRGGKPGLVLNQVPSENEGVLRILFPETEGDAFVAVSWNEFFTRFDQSHLGFEYEEENEDGGQSHFFKFINRNGE